MRIDVLFGAAAVTQADVAGRVVAVIDVLRASTTIATALDNGARCIVPLESAEEVITRSKSFTRADVRLAGERRMRPVPGFDFGNSPAEFTREAVEDRTILFSTTNGTPALVASQGARDVVVASYVNYSAALAFLRTAARGGIDVTIVCAGRERYFALEDAACAGRIVRGVSRRMPNVTLNDGAQVCVQLDRHHGEKLAELFAEAEHGRALAEAGFGDDLVACAQIDAHPVVPVYVDRQIVKLGPDWER
ncbi:MAG: 2-phosphosulfolactate phosphatase [Gemmatirosa sp.]|nr:2-phosphosulfolactate phosphatase [Gemmatirosa sp.]